MADPIRKVELHEMLGLPRQAVEVRLQELGTTAEVVLADPAPVKLFNRLSFEHARANKASLAEHDNLEDTKGPGGAA